MVAIIEQIYEIYGNTKHTKKTLQDQRRESF